MLDRALVKFPQVDLDTDEGLRGLIVQQGDDEGGIPIQIRHTLCWT
jgi:hypothetical protein